MGNSFQAYVSILQLSVFRRYIKNRYIKNVMLILQLSVTSLF